MHWDTKRSAACIGGGGRSVSTVVWECDSRQPTKRSPVIWKWEDGRIDLYGSEGRWQEQERLREGVPELWKADKRTEREERGSGESILYHTKGEGKEKTFLRTSACLPSSIRRSGADLQGSGTWSVLGRWDNHGMNCSTARWAFLRDEWQAGNQWKEWGDPWLKTSLIISNLCNSHPLLELRTELWCQQW